MRNITVAVATYNRADYLEYLATSLQESVDINRIHLRIYDDHSTRLSRSQIAEIVPLVTEIVVRPFNLKADRNMKVIFEDFLKTEDDLLLLCDSDLILRPGWLDLLLELMPQTDGVLSLYNSRLPLFWTNSPMSRLHGSARNGNWGEPDALSPVGGWKILSTSLPDWKTAKRLIGLGLPSSGKKDSGYAVCTTATFSTSALSDKITMDVCRPMTMV